MPIYREPVSDLIAMFLYSPLEYYNVFSSPSTGMVIIGFTMVIVHCHGFLMGETTGMMTRITMTSAIFSKAS